MVVCDMWMSGVGFLVLLDVGLRVVGYAVCGCSVLTFGVRVQGLWGCGVSGSGVRGPEVWGCGLWGRGVCVGWQRLRLWYVGVCGMWLWRLGADVAGCGVVVCGSLGCGAGVCGALGCRVMVHGAVSCVAVACGAVVCGCLGCGAEIFAYGV